MATATQPTQAAQADSALAQRYRQVRAHTERLCQPLKTEDFVVSSMPDVSPTKWHLGHTTWFFETFVLTAFLEEYQELNPKYSFVFNSQYVQAGERQGRVQRGLATRPTVKDILAYRAHVDEQMSALIERLAGSPQHPACALIELGLQHEQQHQELLLADVKHVFWTDPMRPSYHPWKAQRKSSAVERQVSNVDELSWCQIDEGVHHIGHGTDAFAFDHERPRHRVFIEPFRIASRLVTNAEFREFIRCGGYKRPELWLARGWSVVQEQQREAPLYWERKPDGWTEFTLSGTQPLNDADPVCHVSYYEADAYARWAGYRLPTEAEWEVAVSRIPDLPQVFGRRWQWTRSAYLAYPGYVPAQGALGEYNGKWMSDQWVLRGSSSVTPPGHERVTYRNFFPSDTRWQFTGIRLAAS